jgi:hypothetical protein
MPPAIRWSVKSKNSRRGSWPCKRLYSIDSDNSTNLVCYIFTTSSSKTSFSLIQGGDS